MDRETLVKVMTTAGLLGMMLSMGLGVKVEEVVGALRRPRQVVLGLVANFVLVPAVTVGLLRLFDAPTAAAVGFLVLAVCPGAPVGPPFTTLARGDIPYAIGEMVLLAGLSAVLSPALLSLLMAWMAPGSGLHVDTLAIVRTLLVLQMLPLGVGLAVSRVAPKIAGAVARPLGLAANVLLVGVLVLVLVREYEGLAAIRVRGWLGMVLLLGACLAVGWVCGGPGRGTRKALALTTAVRNFGVGLVIVAGSFPGTLAVTAVTAMALVSIGVGLAAAALFGAWREKTDKSPAGVPRTV